MLALSQLRRYPAEVARGLARRGWAPERIAAIMDAISAAGDDDAALTEIALTLPNLPAAATPPERVFRREWGVARREDWMRPHWEVMTDLRWLDAARGARIAEPRFTLLHGAGARLERTLQAWMIDQHVSQHGYDEIAPPLVANSTALRATGHLPHFQDEMFRLAGDDAESALWLNPTAEVPLVALRAGEMLPARRLPLRYVAGLASFRREVGSARREARGLLRLHQFPKVELVQLVAPEQADDAFEALTRHAEAVLEALDIPYRTVELPAPDLSFAAARGRDIEAWFPGMGAWIEVSSISDCGAFQARRANIRYAPGKGKPRFVHTLNASGLAVGRTLAALVEHRQTAAGTVDLPDWLSSTASGANR